MPRTLQRKKKRHFCGNRVRKRDGEIQGDRDDEARPLEPYVREIEIKGCTINWHMSTQDIKSHQVAVQILLLETKLSLDE